MNRKIEISLLVNQTEVIPTLKQWFEKEWVSYYGPTGPGDAEEDLSAYSKGFNLPIGVIALIDGEICGIVVLKNQSITTHTHLHPWAGAGLVAPRHRRRGIGAQLLTAVENLARALGYSRIHCGTATAVNLLCRADWQCLEQVTYNGVCIYIYEKQL